MHDSAACLVENGQIVAAVEEERLTRNKHAANFPKQSIESVLEMGGITVDQVSQTVFGMRPSAIRDHILQGEGLRGFPRETAYFSGMLHWYRTVNTGVRHGMRDHFDYTGEIYALDHHLSHAASAFYCSPFDQALVVTADGSGDRFTLAVWRADKSGIHWLEGSEYPDSIGLLYSLITYHLGLGFFGEGKTMGLASYGRDTYRAFFDQLLIGGDTDTSLLRLNRDFLNTPRGYLFLDQAFNEKACAILGPRRAPNAPLQPQHADIAASLQARLERYFLAFIPRMVAKYGISDLCMAGGVALNAVVNGRLLSESHVSDLFVQPAASDAGTALGAALYFAHNEAKQPRGHAMKTCAIGPGITEDAITTELDRYNLPKSRPDDLTGTVASLLADGKIVGWVRGRLEFGPRALGQRSILASPCLPHMKDHLNKQVKFRENFRPFGAMVPREDCNTYFDIDHPSPFMLLVARVRDRENIPSATHIDGSARLQTVEHSVDSTLWQLLKAFGERTGVPVLLNTSYNVKGEPIVCTAQDAIADFLMTKIDFLVIGDYLVPRPQHLIDTQTVKGTVTAPRTVPKPTSVFANLRDFLYYCFLFGRARVTRTDKETKLDRIT